MCCDDDDDDDDNVVVDDDFIDSVRYPQLCFWKLREKKLNLYIIMGTPYCKSANCRIAML